MSYRDLDQFSGKPTPESFGIPLNILEAPKQYERELPLLSRTLAFVNQFRRADKPKVKEKLVGQMALTIVRSPESLPDLLNNFELINQLRPEADLGGMQDSVLQYAVAAAGKRSNLPVWNPQRIEQLVRVGLNANDEVQAVAVNMQQALFNAPENIEESVDLHYNTAWTTLSTRDKNVREELTSILCYEKEWLDPASVTSLLFILGVTGLTDDGHIKKAYATQDAITGIFRSTSIDDYGRLALNSVRSQTYHNRLKASPVAAVLRAGPKIGATIMRLMKTRRFETITQKFNNDHIQEDSDKLFNDYFHEGRKTRLPEAVGNLRRYDQLVREASWPYSLKYDSREPLRRLALGLMESYVSRTMWENLVMNRREEGFRIITERPIQLSDNFGLLIAAKDCESPEMRNQAVRTVYSEITSDTQAEIGKYRHIIQDIHDYVTLSHLGYRGIAGAKDNIDYFVFSTFGEEQQGRLASIIEVHRPYIPIENIGPIKDMTSSIREKIGSRFTKSVGKRGYRLLIADPLLRNLGYRSIDFSEGENREIKVRVNIGDNLFSFSLDSRHDIVLGGDVLKFANQQDEAWLELFTLSHLEKLTCTEENKIEAELVGGEKQLRIYKRQSVDRIEHLRRQAPGRQYSSDAYIKCLKSGLPINRLDLINKMRAERGEGGTIETGLWTYVSPAEKIDTTAAAPVKVAFANATEDLRKVIPLGEVSDAELDRMEKDILGELV